MNSLKRFTCEEAFRRLDDYLDHELSPDAMALVQEHLEICASCAREFNFEVSVLNGVRQKLRQIEMPADIMSRIALALATARQRDDDEHDGDSVRSAPVNTERANDASRISALQRSAPRRSAPLRSARGRSA